MVTIGKWIARMSVLHPWRVLSVGLALSAVSSVYTAQLFMNLRPDLEELLPETAPSVMSLSEIKSRIRATEQLVILLLSNNDQKVPRATVEKIAAALKEIPDEISAGVEYRIDREIQFFDKRRLRYMEAEDLGLVENYIRQKIRYEIDLYNPLNIFSGEELDEPRIDLEGIQKKYAAQTSAFGNYPGGYYASPDEKKFAIIVNMPASGKGISSAFALREAVDQAFARIGQPYDSEAFSVRFSGGPQDMIEEFQALIKDVGMATAIVLLLTLAVVIFFFRSWLGTVALLLALGIGTLVCFGLSFFFVGYMNANSAFMGSIVIGNGINVGIMSLARYYEERRRGVGHLEGIELMIFRTARATWTAAMAAGLAYGSLMLTSFRGFSQFGVIGFIGMVACWVCTMAFMPSFLTLIYGRGDHPDFEKKPSHPIVGFVGRKIQAYPFHFTAAAAIMTVAFGTVMLRFDGDLLETDLTKLRDRESMEKGSGYYAKIAEKIFGRTLSPLVIMAYSRDEAREIRRRMEEHRKTEMGSKLIERVMSMDDFIPSEQERKDELIRRIDRLLTPRVRSQLSPADQELVGRFINPEVFQPVQQKSLPPLVLEKFTERDGSVGNLVLVYPPSESVKWGGEELTRFVNDVRKIAAEVSPKAPVAGQLAVSSDLIAAIWKDGPRATLLAFLAVAVLVFLIFRHLVTSLQVLTSLLLGVVWLGACIILFNIKINFMNFIALPITFGIGVDYGVNIFERYREEGPGRIIEVIESTGGAVTLASLTTIIGYGSLLLAGNLAFVSFGQIAILGEFCCIITAVIVAPAMLVSLACLKARSKPVSQTG